MTNYRHNRRLPAVGFLSRPLWLVFAATWVCALQAGATAPASRSRHPLPTALHRSTVSQSESPKSARGHKGAAKAHPGAQPAGTAKSGGQSRLHAGAAGKAHGKHTRPADEVLPFYRAKQGKAPASRVGSRQALVSQRGKGRAGYAPVAVSSRETGRSAKGRFEPSSAGRRAVAAEMRSYPRLSKEEPQSRPSPASTSYVHERKAGRQEGEEAEVARRPVPVPIVRPEAYAEGVSRPDDDENLPRPGTDTALRAAAPTTARLSAAPPLPSKPAPSPSPAVVQGFGSELAVPVAPNAERPGGTRRRNHPATWTPEALVNQPELLEERESITEAAVSPAVLPEIYDRNGRLLMPAPLKGSHLVLLHQNVMATTDGLDRIQDDVDLDRLRYAHLLVGFPVGESLRMNDDLPSNRRCARPWTVTFAGDLARAFYARFRQPIQINSAVRTIRYQARLQTVNGNAAATYGDAASPHLTGQAIDIAKRGMSDAQLAWMRAYLLPWMQSGKIDVEEEFHQACFHVSVYRSYTAGRRLQHEVAQVNGSGESGSGAGPAAPAEGAGSHDEDNR